MSNTDIIFVISNINLFNINVGQKTVILYHSRTVISNNRPPSTSASLLILINAWAINRICMVVHDSMFTTLKRAS